MDIREFTASKRQMFDISIGLFASQNFEIITMADIATATGRSVAAIYNHFKSKQDIIAVAYEFFDEHYFDTKLPITAYKPMVQEASLHQIIRAMMFEFVDEYAYLLKQILCIIYQRAHVDERAKEIYSNVLVKQSIDYASDVLDYLVMKGRTEPFNTLNYARVFYSIRQGTFTQWQTDPTDEHYAKLRYEEDEQISCVLSSIIDKKNPINVLC